MAITKKVLRQRAEKAAAEAKAEADKSYLAGFGFTVGDELRVEGERAVFRLVGVAPGGAVNAIDDATKSYRSFRPEWCYPAWRVNRRGRKVRTKCPPAKKGLRANWLAEQGLRATTPPKAAVR